MAPLPCDVVLGSEPGNKSIRWIELMACVLRHNTYCYYVDLGEEKWADIVSILDSVGKYGNTIGIMKDNVRIECKSTKNPI